jgi:hypothetical protein
MAVNTGKKPEKCPNPECASEGGFTCRGVRFQYDVRTQVGTLQAEQIPRTRITTWECDACHSLIEVWRDL